ncbi:inverse autotransporter beta domain-containing protein|uniref:Invasin beta-domain of outer membrane n=1 Tax=Dendrosporobacter quercicolus TaxID=146817 RepID=A0A1G9XC91_9FIRM|nr:inverse autotransporter beta domain-containing protein [Dendrosporobacter quercicolus]NSL49891.1 inverse autotransporter beta domain-containing protein [Dendrosporobacter quercicolus DSM 1736]SDM94066.1 Invasin beta-domain of outer membrane [Dendrosporobacter quercicolus]
MRGILLVFIFLSLLQPPGAAAEEVSLEEGLAKVGNSYLDQELRNFKKSARYDWLERTDLGLRLQADGTPVYVIETVQPLGDPAERITSLTQFRLGNDTGGLVANAGIGRRILSADKASMYTVSIFYDYGFDHGHERIGGSIEYTRGRNKYQANLYYAISEARAVNSSNSLYERALSGYDYSVGTTLAYAPWAQFYIKGFGWNHRDLADDVDFKVYTQLQVTPRLNIEWGYLDNDGEHYGKILYSLGTKGPAMIEKGKRIFRNEGERLFFEPRLEKLPHKNEIYVVPVQGD